VFRPGFVFAGNNIVGRIFFNEFLLHSFPKKHCFLNEVNAKALE